MLDIAVVGLGGLGQLSAREIDGFDDVTVVAGADPSPAAREAFIAEFDRPVYEDHADLITDYDVDAALINTPHTLHYRGAKDFLDAGAHVHLEKPFVTDLDHGRELVALADDRGLALGVGYQRRFDPRYAELRRLVREGRIGEPHTVVAHLEQDWKDGVAGSWRTDPELSGGGQLSDSGSHLLDALLWITDADPAAVAAVADNRGTDVDVNTALAAELTREDGRITASIGVTGEGTGSPAPTERLEVFGTAGSLRFDGERIAVVEAGSEPGYADRYRYTAEPEEPPFDELTRRKLSNFVAAIRGEDALRSTGREALRTVALTDAAYESATTGERVPIGDLP